MSFQLPRLRRRQSVWLGERLGETGKELVWVLWLVECYQVLNSSLLPQEER